MSGSRRNIQTVIRNLQRRNARRRQPEVVLEGVRLLEEAMTAGVTISRVAASPALERAQRGRGLLLRLEQHDIPVDRLTDDELRHLADTDTPQGVLAVAEPVGWSLEQIPVAVDRPVLLLDQIQDPGNVGTIIRTAHGLGAAGVILLPGSAHPTHPKVLRAAMGSTFHLPVVRVEGDEVAGWLADHGVEVWVADATGAPVPSVPRSAPVGLVLGNEGAGVSEEWSARAVRSVAVPLQTGVESLNAAAAAAILLYEVRRDS